MKSLKINAFYSLINQFILVIIPFITFPYVSRILGARNYGLFTYANSIVNIFAVFGGLGVASYATREISIKKSENKNLNQLFQELFFIQLILTSFIFFIYLVIISSVSDFRSDFIVFFLIGMTLLTNLFSYQWFFVGIENFKLIAIRDGCIKVLFMVAIFVFVREDTDLIIYILITLLSFLATAVLNGFSLFKNIKFTKTNLNFQLHFKPVSIALAISFISTVTVQLNPIVLRNIASDEILGIYNVGIRIITMVVTIIVNASTIMLPRLSSLSGTKNKESQSQLMYDVFHLLGIISIPGSIGLFIYSEWIILTLFGEEFMASIPISQITAFALLPMALIPLLYNFLYSIGKENLSIYNMVISLGFNIILIILGGGTYSAIGFAYVFMATEIIKLVIYFLILKRLKIKIKLMSMNYFLYLGAAIVAIALPQFLFTINGLFINGLMMILSCFFYFFILYLFKEEMTRRALSNLRIIVDQRRK